MSESYIPSHIIDEFIIDECNCVNTFDSSIDTVMETMITMENHNGVEIRTIDDLGELIKKCVALKKISVNLLQ